MDFSESPNDNLALNRLEGKKMDGVEVPVGGGRELAMTWYILVADGYRKLEHSGTSSLISIY